MNNLVRLERVVVKEIKVWRGMMTSIYTCFVVFCVNTDLNILYNKWWLIVCAYSVCCDWTDRIKSVKKKGEGRVQGGVQMGNKGEGEGGKAARRPQVLQVNTVDNSALPSLPLISPSPAISIVGVQIQSEGTPPRTNFHWFYGVP